VVPSQNILRGAVMSSRYHGAQQLIAYHGYPYRTGVIRIGYSLQRRTCVMCITWAKILFGFIQNKKHFRLHANISIQNINSYA